ncbi:acetyltransferase [Reinekea forsetii]|nr:acetyltransferase [Reinekea forsetii]
MTKILAIIGASGHGKVVADIAEILGFEVVFFDDAFPQKKTHEHWRVAGTLSDLIASKSYYDGAFAAIGNAVVRQGILCELQKHDIDTPTLIHPAAIISKYAKLSDGCVVLPGAVINSFSNIGLGCIVNTNAIIEHDCHLGRFVHLCPNTALAGGVVIGDRSWIGIGSSVRQMVKIGPDVIVGAGSVVVKNIAEGVTVVGAPAKELKD